MSAIPLLTVKSLNVTLRIGKTIGAYGYDTQGGVKNDEEGEREDEVRPETVVDVGVGVFIGLDVSAENTPVEAEVDDWSALEPLNNRHRHNPASQGIC